MFPYCLRLIQAVTEGKEPAVEHEIERVIKKAFGQKRIQRCRYLLDAKKEFFPEERK